MNRRALLKAAAAAAAAMVPGMSRANGFQAVAFDGRTYLINPGTDPSLALPVSATAGLIAYSYQTSTTTVFNPYGVVCGIFNPTATGPGPGLWVLHSTTSSGSIVELIVTLPTQNAGGVGGWATIPSDGNWHQIILGFNAAKPSMKVVLDGRSLPMTYAPGNNTQGRISFGVPILIGAQGGGPRPAFAYKGALADVWGCFGQAIDAADPQVVAGFWDARHQEAARISADGQSAIGGVRPNFFLSGDVGKFLQNGPSSIGYFSLTSSYPKSPFTVGAGALRQPDSDPWNYAVVGTSAAAATARVIGARRRLGMPVR